MQMMTLAEIEAAAFVSTVEVETISRIIQPYLKGRDPVIQGGVLADLMATWLFGFQNQRERLKQRDDLIALVDGLVDCLERQRAELQ